MSTDIDTLRPELDLYLVAGAHIEDLAGVLTRRFRRVFLREDQLELHLSLLRRVSHLYDTPFFTAIQEHARRPAGVFHALPISRGGRYTLANVVPACPACNASKCNTEVTVWMRRKKLDEKAFLVRQIEIARALVLVHI